MYTDVNYKTKKDLKEAVARGDQVTFYQPGPFAGNEPKNGKVVIEGPHFPASHKWYAECTVENGLITKVK